MPMALALSPHGGGGLFSALLCFQGPEQDGCLCFSLLFQCFLILASRQKHEEALNTRVSQVLLEGF